MEQMTKIEKLSAVMSCFENPDFPAYPPRVEVERDGQDSEEVVLYDKIFLDEEIFDILSERIPENIGSYDCYDNIWVSLAVSNVAPDYVEVYMHLEGQKQEDYILTVNETERNILRESLECHCKDELGIGVEGILTERQAEKVTQDKANEPMVGELYVYGDPTNIYCLYAVVTDVTEDTVSLNRYIRFGNKHYGELTLSKDYFKKSYELADATARETFTQVIPLQNELGWITAMCEGMHFPSSLQVDGFKSMGSSDLGVFLDIIKKEDGTVDIHAYSSDVSLLGKKLEVSIENLYDTLHEIAEGTCVLENEIVNYPYSTGTVKELNVFSKSEKETQSKRQKSAGRQPEL